MIKKTQQNGDLKKDSRLESAVTDVGRRNKAAEDEPLLSLQCFHVHAAPCRRRNDRGGGGEGGECRTPPHAQTMFPLISIDRH